MFTFLVHILTNCYTKCYTNYKTLRIKRLNQIVLLSQYPGKKGRNTKDHPELPALVRCMLWFGLDSDCEDWTGRHDEGRFTVYAETVCRRNLAELFFRWEKNIKK